MSIGWRLILTLVALGAYATDAAPAEAAFPGANGRLVWTHSFVGFHDPSGDYDYVDTLFTSDARGHQRLELGASPGYANEAAFSPDGQRLAYTLIKREPRLTVDVMVARSDGTDAQYLIYGGAHPAWSPDGQRIVFKSTRGQRALALATVGSGISEARPVTGTNWNAREPDWGVNGTIAFVRDKRTPSIYTVKPESGRPRVLIGLGDSPDWSPDGKRLLFTRPHVDFSDSDLYVAGADGSHIRLLARNAEEPSWSPDGKAITFVRGDFARKELWVMRANGRTQRRIARASHRNFSDGSFSYAESRDPDWQPVPR